METDEELLVGFWSMTVLDSATTALFVIVRPAVPALTIALTKSVEVVFGASVPTVQMPVLVLYVPCEVVAEIKVKPGGKTSVAVTPVEEAGPNAETVTV
jgi:hypothetical protein